MTPLSNYSLTTYNSFGFDITAKYFAKTHNDAELKDAVIWAKTNNLDILPLGGGSNLVLTQSPQALVLQQCTNAISVLSEDNDTITLYADAGVLWHDLVLHCVENEYYGIENLSLIPGTVGAAPMQNIGAYGVELADVLKQVHVLEIESLENVVLENEVCNFGYRDSIFKTTAKGRYLITGITIELNKTKQFNLQYAALKNASQNIPIEQLTLADVSNTICEIRNSKLPLPEQIGNAGSFFKNPCVSQESIDHILIDWPEIPFHKQSNGTVKIPAAWMVEKSGWKGYVYKGVGVHRLQSIVLVNYGDGTGAEILELAKLVQDDVYKKFGVKLDIEPVII